MTIETLSNPDDVPFKPYSASTEGNMNNGLTSQELDELRYQMDTGDYLDGAVDTQTHEPVARRPISSAPLEDIWESYRGAND